TPPGARPCRREVWPRGQARAARPFPRVGRSIPRATGGPDEWLLLPLPGREDRIRLTDLLRRGRRPDTMSRGGRTATVPPGSQSTERNTLASDADPRHGSRVGQGLG